MGTKILVSAWNTGITVEVPLCAAGSTSLNAIPFRTLEVLNIRLLDEEEPDDLEIGRETIHPEEDDAPLVGFEPTAPKYNFDGRTENRISVPADVDKPALKSEVIAERALRLSSVSASESWMNIPLNATATTDFSPAGISATGLAPGDVPVVIPGGRNRSRLRAIRLRFRRFIDEKKRSQTPTLLRQIWRSDWTIPAFIPMVISYYLMKYTGYPLVGVLFFILAVATIDAILSIFVIRLSFHQNKFRFYQTEDFERDQLRYRVLLSITKGILFFMIGMTCGWSAIVGAYITWYFATTERMRYLILRWSMDEEFPELEKWTVFRLLKEFDVRPTARAFNLVAAIGLVLSATVTIFLDAIY